MKKPIYQVLIALFVIATIIIAVIWTNPLLKSPDNIRKKILREIPIGTSMTETEQLIENKSNWTIQHISYEHGYGIDINNTPLEDGKTTVGSKYMRIHLGEYSFVLSTTDVIAYLGFDENSNLIDVSIRKDIDSF